MTENEQKPKPRQVITGQFSIECVKNYILAAQLAGNYLVEIMADGGEEFTCADSTTCKVEGGNLGIRISHSPEEVDFKRFWATVERIDEIRQDPLSQALGILDPDDLVIINKPRIFIKPPSPRLRFLHRK